MGLNGNDGYGHAWNGYDGNDGHGHDGWRILDLIFWNIFSWPHSVILRFQAVPDPDMNTGTDHLMILP